MFQTLSNTFKLCPTRLSKGSKNVIGGFAPPGYGPGSVTVLLHASVRLGKMCELRGLLKVSLRRCTLFGKQYLQFVIFIEKYFQCMVFYSRRLISELIAIAISINSVTRGLSQGGKTLLMGAHWTPFGNAIISSQIFT